MNFDHIKKPLTLAEIIGEYESGKYSHELLLQHLLFLVTRRNDITPRMLQAGADEHDEWHKDNIGSYEYLEAVYKKMECAKNE